MSDDDHIKALKEALVREKERGDEMRIRTIELLDFTDKSEGARFARANVRGALEGDPPSEHDIGAQFDQGYGVPVNKELAFYWFKLGAEHGDAFSMNDVANKYAKGVGTMFDGEEAIKWYTKSAELGTPEAKGNLAYCHLCGKCIERDPKKAVELLEEIIATAPKGRLSGRNYYNLATCYERGEGVKKNVRRAIELYHEAAERGCEDAYAALERLEI